MKKTKAELEKENIEFKKRHKSLLLKLNVKTKAFNKLCDENLNIKKEVNYWIEICQEKNKEIAELKITPSPDTVYINRLRAGIIESKKENEALKSAIEALRAIDKAQKIILQENEEAITGLASENSELISETQRLNHLVEAQKVEIENYKNERVDLVFHLANAKLEIGELKDKICGLSDDLINVENNNHELLEQIKPTPQPKTSLLQRFINWIS